jgi:hypothetical protein
MLTKTLAATAALSMLVAGGSALAAQKKMSPTAAGPKTPVPYDQLNAYLKASPKARASKDWWAGSASTGQATTGMPADTAATAPAMTSDPATTAPPAASTSMDTSVNPAPTAAPPSLPMTPPTNAAPQPGDPTMPSQPATPPIEPK